MRHPRLTDDQALAIRAAVAAGSTKEEAVVAAGATLAQFDAATRPGGPLHGLRIARQHRPPAADPSPLELRARAAEVRQRWTPERWLGLDDRQVVDGRR